MLELIKQSCIAAPQNAYRPLFRWSVTDGLQRLDIDLAPQSHNSDPKDVLGHIRAVKQPGVYVLLDFHPFLTDPVNTRLLKDICLEFAELRKHLVLVSPDNKLPIELEPFSAKFELSLPNAEAREQAIREIAADWSSENTGQKVRSDAKALKMLINNLSGLPIEDVRRLAHNAIYDDGVIADNDLPAIMQAKYQLLNQSGLLSFEYETAGFGDIGGMRRLKNWLSQRKDVFAGKAKAAHLEAPKGVLLIGVQGCGKSLAAKATAGIFNVPLLRLDFATIYNKFHGETEKNLRESLQLATSLAPCVLWIDELEKGIAVGNDNSGTAQRVLGSFLTWMNDRQESVFVVATANDISALPPELVRKGRFDEIFFVDLPRRTARADIMRLHLARRELNPDDFDLGALAAQTRGFSGAEIEQLIVSSLYSAYSTHQDVDTALLLAEAKATRPLSVVMAENVDALRRWAAVRAVPSD